MAATSAIVSSIFIFHERVGAEVPTPSPAITLRFGTVTVVSCRMNLILEGRNGAEELGRRSDRERSAEAHHHQQRKSKQKITLRSIEAHH